MHNQFVEDGESRYEETEEILARRCEIEEAVIAKYATQFADAGIFRRLLIRWVRYRELCRELRRITPSIYSLW